MPERMKFHKKRAGRKPPRKAPKIDYGKNWPAIRAKILLRDKWQCQSCGRICADRYEAQVDHRVAKRDGGDDSDDNLQTLCLTCHGRKSREEASRWGLNGAV
jgi:5-methylcytosine-specific restriction protein A